MKKFGMYVCVGAMALCLAACGNKENGSGQGTDPGAATDESTTVEESKVTEESTDAGDTDFSDGAEDDGFFDDDFGDMDDIWGAEITWSDEMQPIRDAVAQELGDNYWPTMALPAEQLEGYGVTADQYEDYMGEIPMMMTHVDTLLVIKAKEGQAEAVEKALNKYRDDLVSSTGQYPMNVGKIQGSKVERIGNYVCFVQLGGDVTEAEVNGEEAIIVHCQEQNDRAIEAIANCIEQ